MELLELPLTASPTRCEVDFSPWGSRVEAAESLLPLNLSPMCSVVDFSESGCDRGASVRGAEQGRRGSTAYLERGGGLVGEALAAGVGHGDDREVVVVRVVKSGCSSRRKS